MDLFLAIEGPDEPKSPQHGGWRSIGHFYDVISEGLKSLAKKEPEQVFPATGAERQKRLSLQVGPEEFYNSGGEVIKVTDLKTALLAMEIIVEQGEGIHDTIFTSDDVLFGEERQVSHYFRFQEIRQGRRYSPYDLPGQHPTGMPLDVDWDAVYPIDVITSPLAPGQVAYDFSSDELPQLHERVQRFNRAYARLLAQLHWSFNHSPTPLKKAVPTMLELRYMAEELFRVPHPQCPELYVGPTFEVSARVMQDEDQRVQEGLGIWKPKPPTKNWALSSERARSRIQAESKHSVTF